MKEDIVSFETALLAKQKGFPQSYEDTEIHKAYSEDGELGSVFDSNKPHTIIAPTHALLQKGLREEHNLIVIVNYIYEHDSTPFTFFIYEEGSSTPINEWEYDFESYPEAMERGLQEALKRI